MHFQARLKYALSVLFLTLGICGCGQIYDSVAEDTLAPASAKLKIPRIMHQVWHAFDDVRVNPPAKHQAFTEEFKANHPGWEYMYWTKEKSREFVKTYYPQYLETYLGYKKEIQRADTIRYFALHHFGGVYADFDSQNLRNLEPLLRGFDAVFGEQPNFYHAIHNGFMASIPKHPLWPVVFEELENSKSKYSGRYEVVMSTGPEMITRAIHTYRSIQGEKPGVKVVGPKYFLPLKPEDTGTKGKICRDSSEECRKLFPNAFSVEHWSNSW